MIDENFIEKVKSALNIVNVIETFTHLYKTGANYKGVCPFHDDHSPSMVVSPSRQTYHCFVCGGKEVGEKSAKFYSYYKILFNRAFHSKFRNAKKKIFLQKVDKRL